MFRRAKQPLRPPALVRENSRLSHSLLQGLGLFVLVVIRFVTEGDFLFLTERFAVSVVVCRIGVRHILTHLKSAAKAYEIASKVVSAQHSTELVTSLRLADCTKSESSYR